VSRSVGFCPLSTGLCPLRNDPNKASPGRGVPRLLPAAHARCVCRALSLNCTGTIQVLFMRRPLASTPRSAVRQETTMSEQIKSQIISRRRLFWLAAIAVALAAPATMLSTSDARAQQSDQAPAAEPTAPKSKAKKKKKKKKATPGATTAPASSPPAPPKQQ
jgi:hypothetical protein